MDGNAHFLLPAKNLDDVILIEANKGDIIVIPPGYGHVTINPTPGQTLTFAQSCLNGIYQRLSMV
jgi:glucose-6-phosphate isomerase